ncbi:MAG: ArnT family glycosyltransferase [Cumulibacter sp.]
MSFLGSAILNVLIMPWSGTADSSAHMDYVYQVHKGHIPAPYGYEWNHPGLPEASTRTARQWASAHPPLFYYLASLVAGAFMDSGEWVAAIVATRLLNALFGGLVVVALAWAGWQLGGSRRAIIAVAAPAFGALVGGMNRFTGNEYNDTLVSLFAIVSLTLASIILRDGPTPRRLILLFPLAAGGMASKATYAVALILVLIAVVVAFLLHRRPDPNTGPRSTARAGLLGVGWCAAILAFVAITIGWFYRRNYQLSGSWSRSTPKAALQNRERQSMGDVLTNPDYYKVVPEGLLGRESWNGIWPYNHHLSLAIAMTCLLLLLARLVARGRWRQLLAITPQNAIWLMLLAHLVGHYVAQLQQATGWGAINYRYFQPATLTITLILAFGATAWRRLGPLLVAILTAIFAAGMVLSFAAYLARAYPELSVASSIWTSLSNALTENDLPPTLAPIAVALLWLGVLVTTVSLFASRRFAEAFPQVPPVGKAPTMPQGHRPS